MANFIKWLGVALGFTLEGPIGALLGYALGSIFDSDSFTEFNTQQKNYNKANRVNQTTPGDFEISLLILASIVIKADKKINKKELDYVRVHFIRMYGKEKANRSFKLFNGIIKKNISIKQVCTQIRTNITHASRLQLLHFLFGIAQADGNISESEELEIKKIAYYLYINSNDYASIKAMFYNDADVSYKILEIDKSATNSEIKKAYRKMAKKYHPDRIQNISEEHMTSVKEKFQKIQEAYEKIKAEKNFK